MAAAAPVVVAVVGADYPLAVVAAELVVTAKLVVKLIVAAAVALKLVVAAVFLAKLVVAEGGTAGWVFGPGGGDSVFEGTRSGRGLGSRKK